MRARTFPENRPKSPAQALLAALLFTAVLIPSTRSDAQTSRLIPLHSWWSGSNQDHLCTSDSRWAGSTGKKKDAYRYYRHEGYIYAPSGPQPPNTMPLYRWWSPGRKDQFTTTNPSWKGVPGQSKSGYRFVRLEGYVLKSSGSGRLPLKSYWSAKRTDNVATADSAWEKESRRNPDYRSFRIEGYLLASATGDTDRRNVVVPSTPHPDSPLARRRAEEAARLAEEAARLDHRTPLETKKGTPPTPRIISFELTPTTEENYGGDWIEISWKTDRADRVRLYEDGREIEGRFQLSNGEYGWPLSLERGFKTQYDRNSIYKLVATNNHGKASKTLDVKMVDEGNCRVTVSITGQHAQFTDAVGVLQIEPGRPDKFLFKSPVSTVRDHRENKDPAPYKRSIITLPPGEYFLVPTGGGKGKRGYFGVIYKPRRSRFTCRDGNSGRISFRSDYTEY